MKFESVLVLAFSGYVLCSVLSNVRLVDHTGYAIEVITKTMNVVEKRGWCNLKLPDLTRELNENILNNPVKGSIKYTNGFVTSIQHVDIQQSTVQQVWFHNTSAQVTTATVRATLRMLDLTVGYDVIAEVDGKHYRYTTTYTHPLVTFVFSIIRDVNADTLDVTVVGTVPRTTRLPSFLPIDDITDILTPTFDPTAVTAAGILAWGPEVLEPIAYQMVTEEIPYPRICYDCPA